MKKWVFLILVCCLFNSYGETYPYFNLSTQTNSQNPWVADLWLPLTNSQTHYFFSDINASYSPQKYTRSLELGGVVRKLSNDDWAWGSYAYVSYNRSLLGNNFYTINPGLEFLNRKWHFSWNTYLPISATHQSAGNIVWADDVGIYQYIRFAQHQQFNQKVQLTSSTGVGTDFIVGYHIEPLANTKLSAGVYYFNMPSHPIGFVAVAETPVFKRISFNIGFSHDPLTNNTVTLGIKLHLDGKHDAADQSNWINEQTQHNLIQITQANTIPISSGYRTQGQDYLQKDNIWFFNPDAPVYNSTFGLANCTYEHPCSNLNIDTTFEISQISQTGHFQDQPSLYLSPGVYPSSSLFLFNNESINGRSSDYVFPASGNDRAQIYTNELTIDGLTGNWSNTVANVALYNNGGNFAAVNISNAQNVYFDNVQIGAMDSVNTWRNYNSGMLISDSENVSFTNSTISVNNYFTDALDTIGITIDGVQNLYLQNSAINTLGVNTNMDNIGILINSTSNLSIQNSQLHQQITGLNVNTINLLANPTVSANLAINNSGFVAIAEGDGTNAQNLFLVADSRASINNSIFTATTSSTGSNQNTFGVQLHDRSYVSMSNSSITSSAQSVTGKAAATNFFLYDDSRLELTNSNLYAFGSCALVTGNTAITLDNNSTASVVGGTLETYMAGGPSSGEPSGAVTIWTLANSPISISNAQVIARSGNDKTAAAPIQAQEDSIVLVTDSYVSAFYDYGNTTDVPSTAVISTNNSQITIENSRIAMEVLGGVTNKVALLTSYGDSVISVSNSVLKLLSFATPADPTSLNTYGAFAGDSSIIYLSSNLYYLQGSNVELSGTSGAGQVIITN